MSALVQADRLSLEGRLERTSIHLEAGQFTCLIGPNGSGKTSLLHAIAGIGGGEGDVSITGSKLSEAAPEQRRRLVSYLPATRDIAWPLAAADLIALGAPSAIAPDEIAELLEALNLSSFAGRRVDRMSTGERSRVLIARALVATPKLLLLDEPAANLDPLWQMRVMELLRGGAHRNGQAILVASHDLELARDYADRLIIMAERRIVADGSPQALLAGPEMRNVFGIEQVDGRWRPACSG